MNLPRFSAGLWRLPYGRLDASDEEIVSAAKIVRADTFISQMSRRYKTEVNERGSRLSQGQKQLIAFARTLLADPKILVLDEGPPPPSTPAPSSFFSRGYRSF
jgi:ABC-type bacteriocin/lantibiotic exporter with double-glycine peptidase domain